MPKAHERIVHLTLAFFTPLVIPLLSLTMWEVFAGVLNNPTILPRATQVFSVIMAPFHDLVGFGSMFSNLIMSLARVFSGFLMASAIGIPLGIFMGYSHNANRLFSGTVAFVRCIPPLAWVPLVLAWCGMNSLGNILGVEPGPYYSFFNNIKISMIVVIFIGSFYPVLVSSMHGVKQVPKTFIDASLVLGASKRNIFIQVLLPASLPNILSGMRIGLGVAWTCLVSAEMLPGTPSGLGYLITHAFSVGRTDIVIAGMFCIGLTGVCFDCIFKFFETQKNINWQKDVK